MIVKLLTEHHLEFLGLKGGCTGSSESTQVKMPNCRKSHATAHIVFAPNISINRTKPTFTSTIRRSGLIWFHTISYLSTVFFNHNLVLNERFEI